MQALESALALGELERVEQLLGWIEALPPGRLPPYLRAQAARVRARLAASAGESEHASERFAAAEALFREFGLTFWTAITELEHGEWLTTQGHAQEAEPLLAEAAETFERLAATPWLERTTRLASAGREPEPVTAGS